MMLRTLAARMRPSALRVPPPAPRNLPPPAPGVRPRFCSSTSAQGGQQGKIFDLDKASREELLRESELIGKQIDEAWDAVRRENDKLPGLMKELFRILKMSFGVGILIEIVSYTAPRLRPAAEPEQ